MFPRACPGRFKSGPYSVQMHPCSNQMQLLLVPYVCLSSLVSKNGCSGLLVHFRHLRHSARTPLPLFPRLGELSVCAGLGRSMVSQRQNRHDGQYYRQSHRLNRVVSHSQNLQFSSICLVTVHRTPCTLFKRQYQIQNEKSWILQGAMISAMIRRRQDPHSR